MPLDDVDIDRIGDKMKLSMLEAMSEHKRMDHSPENTALAAKVRGLSKREKMLWTGFGAIAAKLGIASFFGGH